MPEENDPDETKDGEHEENPDMENALGLSDLHIEDQAEVEDQVDQAPLADDDLNEGELVIDLLLAASLLYKYQAIDQYELCQLFVQILF